MHATGYLFYAEVWELAQFCAEWGRSNFVVWVDDVSSVRSCWEQDRSDWELCLSRHVGTHEADLSNYRQVELLKCHHHLHKHFFLSHALAPDITHSDHPLIYSST